MKKRNIRVFNEYCYRTIAHCYFRVMGALPSQSLPFFIGLADIRAGYRTDTPEIPPGLAGMTILLSGRGNLLTSARDQPVGPGAAVILAPGITTAWRADADGRSLCLLLAGGATTLLTEIAQRRDYCPIIDPVHPIVKRAIEMASDAPDHRLPPSAAHALAQDWISLIWQDANIQSESRLSALAAALYRPDPVASAAARLKISREHLSRQLRCDIGQPPTLWIRHERLRRAAHLLATSTQTVSDIAAAVGLSSSTSFVTAFRSHYGTSPARWRRKILTGGRPPQT